MKTQITSMGIQFSTSENSSLNEKKKEKEEEDEDDTAPSGYG